MKNKNTKIPKNPEISTITNANPITTTLSGTGGPWIPPEPKPLEMPLDWPSHFPNCLKVPTRPIIRKAFDKFQNREDLLDLCKYVVSKLTPLICKAVEKGDLRADQVDHVMQDLIAYILRGNCDDPGNANEFLRQAVGSDKWAMFENKLTKTKQSIPQPMKLRHAKDQAELIPNAEGERGKSTNFVEQPEKPQHSDAEEQKFDPNEYGGVVSCVVVSFFKNGQHNHKKLAKIVRNKTPQQDVPKDVKQWAYRIRKRAHDEGWWEHIPEEYWLSYGGK